MATRPVYGVMDFLAGFRLPGAPSAVPADGEMYTASGKVYLRHSGAWVEVGASGPSGTWPYEWKTSTASTDPAHGYIKANNATATLYTEIYVSVYDKNNQAFLAVNDLTTGSEFHLYEAGQIATWNKYRLTAPPTLQGTPVEWAILPVEFVESGPQPLTPGGNTQMVLTIQGGGGGGGGAAYVRETASKTTALLAADAAESGTITLAASYRLMQITTSAPARVRLYTTTVKRDADAARALGTDPTGDHGLLLEFCTASGLLSADLSPTVDGFDGKATPDGIIPITITNTGASPAAITCTLTWIRTE